ncbi:MAG: vanadium-dependent haloperoxidase [Chloroflexi bacterium]|nr:MAG: vanadium-dependent haloperoxidase [Chloroflexota bacterium]
MDPGSRRRLAIGGLLALAVAVGSAIAVVRPWQSALACQPAPPHPGWSVARMWDEALLDAIRRALPNPPVHARNLFHLSVAMWDAWAAYDPRANGYLTNQKVTAQDVTSERDEAISYAAYSVLESRFKKAVGSSDSLLQFDEVMESLCYPTDNQSTSGDSPAAVGNRIAGAVLAYGLNDGSNEAGGYADPSYHPVNPPLVVKKPGTKLSDPNRWQPLQLEHMISQNGIPVTNGTQQAIGPQWGHVKGFGIPDGGAEGVPMDPGPPPRLGDPVTDQQYKEQAVDVIRASSQLDPASAVMIDISPASRGDNALGTNDGHGRSLNAVTGQPYLPEIVNQGDFTRALAEFWADGPKSETPPGHWNVIANAVSDQLGPNLRIGGKGVPVDRLEWDVKLYLALNGAVHDAAIVAWGLKGEYDSIRPISMIRYLGGLGQSTDPRLPSYNAEGLPLVPGLIELITAETTRTGGPHAALRGHEGEVAIRAWSGPKDTQSDAPAVKWIRAIQWIPYQAPTFATPSFPGYVSGHSTFSRAAAEVMTAFTGSQFFPGGLSEWTTRAGTLKVEAGPTTDVTLEWATYYDAADQAGLSRIYGGIHIAADDFTGRRVGSECGKAAWALAQRYYAGQAAAAS